MASVLIKDLNRRVPLYMWLSVKSTLFEGAMQTRGPAMGNADSKYSVEASTAAASLAYDVSGT